MLIFEIIINDDAPCRIGIDDFCVTSAAIASVLRRPTAEDPAPLRKTWIRIGGLNLSLRQRLEWLQRDLIPGDRVLIRVLEGDDVHAPAEVILPSPKCNQEQAERAEYERLKEKLGAQDE